MLVDQVVTYLEMTSPDQLCPARPIPAVALERVAATSPVLRPTHDRIGAPHHWSSEDWPEAQWQEWLSTSGLRDWLIRVGDQVAGLTSLVARTDNEVEIAVFGLVPDFVGRGYGGHALTLAVRTAWSHPDAEEVRRVWLHTSSLDHPHALSNYRKRGFRPFRTENRPRRVPK